MIDLNAANLPHRVAKWNHITKCLTDLEEGLFLLLFFLLLCASALFFCSTDFTDQELGTDLFKYGLVVERVKLLGGVLARCLQKDFLASRMVSQEVGYIVDFSVNYDPANT